MSTQPHLHVSKFLAKLVILGKMFLGSCCGEDKWDHIGGQETLRVTWDTLLARRLQRRRRSNKLTTLDDPDLRTILHAYITQATPLLEKTREE